MDWDKDFDVKEYRPRRGRKIGADGRELPALCGITRPEAPYNVALRTDASSAPLSGAPLMRTSEVLDFAEGN